MTERTSRSPAAGPTFGEILESFRRRRGVSRRQVARQLGISPAQIRDWERGVEIPIHPGLLRSLEVVLETPEGLLARAAGFSTPAQEAPKMSVRQSLATLAEPSEEPAAHPLDPRPESTREMVPAAFPEPGGGPSGILSYRYNPPEERWVYRIRFLLTAAGVALLGLLLLWAVRQVWGELGNLWNAVFG